MTFHSLREAASYFVQQPVAPSAPSLVTQTSCTFLQKTLSVSETPPNTASRCSLNNDLVSPSKENVSLISSSKEGASLPSNLSVSVIPVLNEKTFAKASNEFTWASDTPKKDNINAELANAESVEKLQLQQSTESLETEAGQFFQSLELQHRTEDVPEKGVEDTQAKEGDKNDNVTFMESIGLYWLNPADHKTEGSIKPGGSQDEKSSNCKSLDVANPEQHNLTLEGEDFLQELQLQHKVECGRTFMESIGLYWLNPADNKAQEEEKCHEKELNHSMEETQEQSAEIQIGEREIQSAEIQIGESTELQIGESAELQIGESAELQIGESSELQIGEGEMGELDFLAMLGLTRKGGGASKRWKLWDPEAAPPITWDPDDELLCSDMYLGVETAANDPTLMEDQVQRFLQSPVKRKESPELKESRGKWLTGSKEEGKWLPGSKEEGKCLAGSEEEESFYCSPCFRTLSTKELYDRHCLSELHFKNSSKTESSNIIRTKRDIRKPRFFDDDQRDNKGGKAETKEKPETTKELEENEVTLALVSTVASSDIERVGRPRECQSCKAKVDPHQYGKHLISHYHYHRSLGHPDNSSIVLSNIGDIVRQAPFQCELCKFYCNWHPELKRHCSGVGHLEMDGQVGGSYWCNICNWFAHSLSSLEFHLGGEDHGEMVAVINRSVPIVIRKLDLVHCDQCGQAFRLKFSLKNHMKVVHDVKDFQLEDHEMYRCKLCSYVSFKKKSMGWHEFLVHPSKKLQFNCYICKKQFHSEKHVKQHRTSLSHREEAAKVKLKNSDTLAESQFSTTCRFCGVGFNSFSTKKTHLESVHLKLLPQCTLCGLKFAFPQKLASHVRSKCPPDSGIRMEGNFKCEECPFSSNLQSNVTMHTILKHSSQGDRDKSETCPLCDKKVSAKNLKRHLLIHGQQFRCEFCYKGFENVENLEEHKRKEHLNNLGMVTELTCDVCEYKTLKKSLLILHVKRKHKSAECMPNMCNICQKSFSNKANLKHHSKVHLNQETDVASLTCDFEGCEYKCQFKCDMVRHKKKHDSTKGITCSFCNFSCKRKSELNRHVKIKHTEGAGIKCKLCDYQSKNKDHFVRHLKSHESDCHVELFVCQYCKAEFRDKANLKKHILLKHPKRGVYNCPEKSCSIEVSSVEEFSDHLSKNHLGALFPNDFVKRHYIKNFHLKSNLPKSDETGSLPAKLVNGGTSFLLCDPPNFVTEQIIEN